MPNYIYYAEQNIPFCQRVYFQEGGHNKLVWLQVLLQLDLTADKIDYRNISHMCQIDSWVVNSNTSRPNFHGIHNENYSSKVFITKKVGLVDGVCWPKKAAAAAYFKKCIHCKYDLL